jgi:hypothetical protein
LSLKTFYKYLIFFQKGLFSGAISGFLIGCWLSLGQFITKPIYQKLIISTYNCTNLNVTTVASILHRSDIATNLSGFDKIYSISYMWLSPIGVCTTIGIGIVVSLITNKITPQFKVKDIDHSLLLYKFLLKK